MAPHRAATRRQLRLEYAPDLWREDFRIYEDGVEHQVAYFAAVDQPFTVALVLDTSGSTEFSIGDIQRAASAFVKQLKPAVEQLKPADRVTVISFDDRIDVLCEPTSDRQELNRAIRRAHGERRQIKVQVSQPNLVVQARDGYVYSQKKAEDADSSDKNPRR